jgi:hypothetical protein
VAPLGSDGQCGSHFRALYQERFRGSRFDPLGIWLPFVVTDYEHERFWKWKVASVRATGHRLQSTDAGGAVLWFEVPVIAFPYIAICRMALTRIADCLADG